MDFKDFINKIANAVKERLGDGYGVSLQTVRKNNGIMLTGLLISSRESNISPVIYLEPFYNAVAKGKATFEGTVSSLAEIYEKNKMNECFDTSAFTEYGSIKGHVKGKADKYGEKQGFSCGSPT